MVEALKDLLKIFAFFLVVFALNQLVFVLYHVTKFSDCNFWEITAGFYYAMPLNLSTAAYLISLPMLLSFVRFFWPKGFLKSISNGFVYSVVFLLCLIAVVDLNIYQEWGTKFNYKALSYLLLSPGEALASISSSPIISNVLLFVLQFGLLVYLYKKFLSAAPLVKNGQLLAKILAIPLVVFTWVMAARGGLQIIPINESIVYYSEKKILNHAAVNPSWALMHSWVKNKKIATNPLAYLKPEDAKAFVDSLYANQPKAESFLFKSAKPNLVFLILESYTADVVNALGGEPNVAPFMEELIAKGLLFDNIYASGDRTDKGLVALLSAYPSQGIASIIMQPDKAEKLPGLPNTLVENGYNHSSFFYGGEPEFANMKSYMLGHGIHQIIDKHAFEQKDMNSKWGAHDGIVLQKQLKLLGQAKEPFCSVLLTLSNHEPFEVPIPAKFKGDDLPNKFRNTAYYTDLMLREYFAEAKKQAWYANTVFVLVADHGHRLPKEYEEVNDPGKFRIPLILFGVPLQDSLKGTRIHTLGSQTDLAATLLNQLRIPANHYVWSRDLLAPNAANFAFYSFDNGFGWVSDAGALVFDNVGKQAIYKSAQLTQRQEDENAKNGKAYMQRLLETFIAY